MSLTLQTLISHLSAAKPETPVFPEPGRAVGTPEEVAAAFDQLNRAFVFNGTNTLKVNESVRLSDAELRYVNASIASFNERLKSENLLINRTADNTALPSVRGALTENQGIRVDSDGSQASAIAQPASAGCTWQWWFNTYWWGFKLSFNSCAISWLAAGGKAIDSALAAFKIPAVATPVVKLVALLLKPFDKGKGSTIYFTWLGVFWITAK